MTMPPSTLGAFAKSDPSLAVPTWNGTCSHCLCRSSANPAPIWAITPRCATCGPSSRGHVRIAGADPLASPKILATTCRRDSDRAALRRPRSPDDPADHGRRRFGPPPAPGELPGPRLTTDDELRAAAGELGTTIFHPVGTCAMGAFDSQGQPSRQPRCSTPTAVYGVAGLRVVDASAMPTITRQEHQRAGDAHRRARRRRILGAGARLRPVSSPPHLPWRNTLNRSGWIRRVFGVRSDDGR